MSVQTELTRISGAKTDLKAAIQSKGVAVPESARIDAYPALVQAITQGTPSLQSKSVTYTANGTATITPDAGYDGLSSVDVTVNVASGGGEIVSLTVTAAGPTIGGPPVWYCSADGVKMMEKYRTPVQCLKNSMVISRGAFRNSTGLTEISAIDTTAYIYQITDNATATLGF